VWQEQSVKTGTYLKGCAWKGGSAASASACSTSLGLSLDGRARIAVASSGSWTATAAQLSSQLYPDYHKIHTRKAGVPLVISLMKSCSMENRRPNQSHTQVLAQNAFEHREIRHTKAIVNQH
jgi:hypothetical protein